MKWIVSFLIALFGALAAGLLVGCTAPQQLNQVADAPSRMYEQFVPPDVFAAGLENAIGQTTARTMQLQGSLHGNNPRRESVVSIFNGWLTKIVVQNGFEGLAGQASIATQRDRVEE